MDAVLLQQSLNGPIQKFESLICLQRLWPAFGERAFQCYHQRRRGLVLQRNAPGHFREDVDHREENVHTDVVSFKIQQVDEIGLSLLTWTSRDDASSLEMPRPHTPTAMVMNQYSNSETISRIVTLLVPDHVTSGNRHTLVDEFTTSGPRDISFEMLHQTSGFGLHDLGNGVHDFDLYSATRSSYCSPRHRPRPRRYC